MKFRQIYFISESKKATLGSLGVERHMYCAYHYSKRLIRNGVEQPCL